jgi:xylulokinase
MSLIGIDVGTSGCKAGIFDTSGHTLGSAYCEYSITNSGLGHAEINPEMVWESVKLVLAQAISKSATSPNAKGDLPRALSVSSLGESVVAIGKDGATLGPSLLYHDCRGNEEAGLLDKRLGKNQLYAISGARPHGMYSIGKIMWLQKHEPRMYASAYKFLLFADFILYRFGAEPRTDYSLAARTMAFDVSACNWSSNILEAAGISPDKFATPVPAGTAIGRIDPKIAAELGLPDDLVLVSGGHDQTCAALGAGVTRSGSSVDGMGTVECITPAFGCPVINQAMQTGHFACVPHVVPGLYVTYAFNLSAGGLLKWYRDTFAMEEQRQAAESGQDVYDLILDSAGSSPGTILVLPYILGAATPYMDTAARGAIAGIGSTSTKGDMVRGILEGICFEMRLNLDHLADAGIAVDELRAVGGLSRSRKMLALKANIMKRRVLTLDVAEAGTLGAAMLAGTAVGEFANLQQAADSCVRIKEEFLPNPAKTSLYDDLYLQYQKLYPAMKMVFGTS